MTTIGKIRYGDKAEYDVVLQDDKFCFIYKSAVNPNAKSVVMPFDLKACRDNGWTLESGNAALISAWGSGQVTKKISQQKISSKVDWNKARQRIYGKDAPDYHESESYYGGGRDK